MIAIVEPAMKSLLCFRIQICRPHRDKIKTSVTRLHRQGGAQAIHIRFVGRVHAH